MSFPFHTLMVQGTTSDAGKTTVVAALCRLLARQGVKVVPFAAEYGFPQPTRSNPSLSGLPTL